MILVLVDVPTDFDEQVRRISSDAEISRRSADIAKASIILGRPQLDDLARASHLEWLQLSSAGANRYVEEVPEKVVLTTASGVYGVPAAEHIFAMMLGLVRSIPNSVRAAQNGEWDRDSPYGELYGRACGILGLGDIGLAVAERAKGFGMRVIAMKRTRADAPKYVDEVFGADELHAILTQSDHIVNTLPDTPRTRYLVDAEALTHVRPGSYFYNIGRGGTVDESALIEALQDGRLAGAGLDVFEEEPLPKERPLWRMSNVIITPHVGGESPREGERVAALFLDNLARWQNGRPLRNVVDRTLGY